LASNSCREIQINFFGLWLFTPAVARASAANARHGCHLALVESAHVPASGMSSTLCGAIGALAIQNARLFREIENKSADRR
jgi:hypothetical protein